MDKLLTDNKIIQPQLPPPQKEEIIGRTVNKIRNMSRESFNQLVETQRRGIDMLWNNPQLTPQEIIDGLGDTAIKVFQFHGGLTEYITAIAAIDGIEVDLKYPTNAFTIDPQTGKITVTTDPYIPN